MVEHSAVNRVVVGSSPTRGAIEYKAVYRKVNSLFCIWRGAAMKSSNYEKMKDSMADVFLRYDQEKMIRKFALKHDEAFLYVDFVGRPYRIDRHTGRVVWLDSSQHEYAAGYNEAMTIYDVLCCSADNCRLSGEWVNVAGLFAIKGGTLAKESDFFHGAGESFAGRTEALQEAFRRLGGKTASGGDLACELALFPFITNILRFWEADEEHTYLPEQVSSFPCPECRNLSCAHNLLH